MLNKVSATEHEELSSKILAQTEVLFPEDPQKAGLLAEDLTRLADSYRDRLSDIRPNPIDEATSYLITYGSSIKGGNEKPLRTLASLLNSRVTGAFTNVHLLPISPSTSDDGFAVVDHREVDPNLGDWDDIANLADSFELMIDYVANHVSASSPWFKGWLAGDAKYEDFFITPLEHFDTRNVIRPRTSPLTHAYPVPSGGSVDAWTTFSQDQVDVNSSNPAVLHELTDILLNYVERGATTIRLDAISYLWKESGSECNNLPQTHAVIKIWKAIVNSVVPGVRIITETNVPHEDNIKYLGANGDEATMVYQFALPPLVVHTFVSGDVSRIRTWLDSLEVPQGGSTWFNFLASHDGIGIRPVATILNNEEREAVVQRVIDAGGAVSYASNPDGSSAPYELNVVYADTLVDPSLKDTSARIDASLAAHALLMSLAGVPAIYYHSLFGSTSDREGMKRSGINRRINRQVLNLDELAEQLDSPTERARAFSAITNMLRVRSSEPAFSPYASQIVLDLGPHIFGVKRGEGPASITCVVNVTDQPRPVNGISGIDVLTQEDKTVSTLQPYEFLWIKGAGPKS